MAASQHGTSSVTSSGLHQTNPKFVSLDNCYANHNIHVFANMLRVHESNPSKPSRIDEQI
jgi:hypothetical protein